MMALNRASTKTADVFVRLTPPQKAELRRMAAARGLSLSAFIRSYLLPLLGVVELAPPDGEEKAAAAVAAHAGWGNPSSSAGGARCSKTARASASIFPTGDRPERPRAPWPAPSNPRG